MDARTFIDTHGSEEAERVAKAAGTNLAYMRQIAGGHRRPSVGLAERLVEASGERLSLLDLLRSKKTK